MARREHLGLLHFLPLVALVLLLLQPTTIRGFPSEEYDYAEADEVEDEEDDVIPEDAEADQEHEDYFTEDGGEEDEYEDGEVVGTSANANADAGPANYSAVDDGLVGPPGNQGQCKSNDAAFASTTAIEACYAKITGQILDLSEQQLLDCTPRGGANTSTAAGQCSRAQLTAHTYLEWVTKNKIKLSVEKDYPYRGLLQNNATQNVVSGCPASLPPPANITGVRIKKTIFTTSKGTEKKLRQMVLNNGAVVTTMVANAAFRKYKGGVFAGCATDKAKKAQEKANHVVAVVGFGKDAASGKAYWLVKNSRGPGWGEKGYMRLQRGVGMCGIGRALAVVECEAVADCTPGDDECEDDNMQDSGEYQVLEEAKDEKDEADEEDEE